MKMQAHLKSRGTATRVIFELKQRVLLALNKISDRDTYQIGVEELEKTIKCLSPEGVSPFLSCILDTDSDQKKAVRKECIRLMGMLATFHQDLIGPHTGKMVASIVKRLKDPDSVVRDACVETMGILASKLSSSESQLEGSFVVLVRPLFEAIGEQNKHVQCGSALCLARVIDNAMDPPVSILQRMLEKTTKLLNNPRFMVKPVIIELNTSIIQAGGASTQSTLTAAMTSIQEALKNSDWRTRKAASSALADIASTNGLYFGSFKSSCIRSLELCRFDKVKPVRDTVLQTLQLWRNLKGTDASELPEAGFFTKGGDYSDILSARESTVKNTSVHRESVEKRVPLSVRKNGHSYVGSLQHSNANDWNIEVNVPNTRNISLAHALDEESEGSSVTKTYERTRSDITSTQDIIFEYVPMDDKFEFSSSSNIDSERFEAKLVPTIENCPLKGKLVNSLGVNQIQVDKEISTEERRYFAKIEDCTESSSETPHGCCMQTAKEIAFFREKLIDIENKQSNLLDLLQVFTTKTADSLSITQSKVSSLEHVVDRMAQNFAHGGRRSESTAKFLTKSSTTASSRLSTCTPRLSVDIRNRKSPLQPAKQSDASEECTFGRGKSGNYANQCPDSWMDPTSRNHASRNRNWDAVFSLDNGRCNDLQVKNSLQKVIKGHLSQGDIEAAYVDALNSGDELILIELFDKTGPVLERLSQRTANVIVSSLASFLSEQQFVISIIPWLQQVVDLCSVHGPNHLVLTAKTRMEFLWAIEEAVSMEFPNAMVRRSIKQLVTKLQKYWGKESPSFTHMAE